MPSRSLRVPSCARAPAFLLLAAVGCSDSGGGYTPGAVGASAGTAGGAGAAGYGGSAGTGGGSDGGGRFAGGAGGSHSGSTGAAGAGHGAAGADAGAGGIAGGAADDGSGGSGGSGVPACPGAEPSPLLSGFMPCTSTIQCQQAMGGAAFYVCALEPISFACGGAAPPPPECTQDADCAPGVCESLGCGQARCAPGCTEQSCGDGARCTAGRCVPKRCDEAGGSCPPDFTCDPSSAAPFGCAPVPCDAGFDCPVTMDCMIGDPLADVHGCVVRACSVATDCDCGACVDGKCAPFEGVCINNSPPP